MIKSMMPLLVTPSREKEVSPCNLTGEDDRLESVSELMSAIAADFSRQARRSLPFLTRYRSGLAPSVPGVISAQGVGRVAGDPPSFGLMLSAPNSGGWLGAWINAGAINLIFEGALGGSALFESAPAGTELTAPQRALVRRVTHGLLEDLKTVVQAQTGKPLPGTPAEHHSVESDGMYVVCEVENLAIPATVIIAASSEILVQAVDARIPTTPDESNPEMLEALKGVDVELVGELGQATLSLQHAIDLTVGDIVRLDTGAGDPIVLRAGGIAKFHAKPMTSRGQMAVEITSRHRE